MKNITAYITLMLTACGCCGKIDRETLVARNCPTVTEMDTLSSLTVGNGHLCYTFDGTGMQTFADEYANGVPLCTMSDWGWHSFENPDSLRPEEAWEEIELMGHKGIYATESKTPGRHKDAANYYRINPHRLNLATIGFRLTDGESKAKMEDIKDVEQKLDMWRGVAKSRFSYCGEWADVTTVCSPYDDVIEVKIKSELLASGKMGIEIRLPYPTGVHSDNAADYSHEDGHISAIETRGNRCTIWHEIDTTRYCISMEWKGDATIEQTAKHTYCLMAQEGTREIDVKWLIAKEDREITKTDTQSDAETWWREYWTNGGVVDFGNVKDERAREIERRVVTSQYLCAINCSGNMPPQESGLTYNTWFGRPHLEMYWWHGLHFAQYGHTEMLDRGLEWYATALDEAKAIAKRQGYKGARWMKMTDPWAGEAPSKVGSFLIWQQPHLIYLAEMVYRQKPTKETLDKYGEMVEETARFMADFATYDTARATYNLKGVIPAQETLRAGETMNPPMELTYWSYGLRIANTWRERRNESRQADWDTIGAHMAPLAMRDSLYLAAETATETYHDIRYTSDHPAVLGAYGMLPPMTSTDKAVMKNTFDWIWANWNWDKTWGWDYPMTAMAAARLGEREKAVDALLMKRQKNTYLVSGHNYQDQRLRVYLPGNGGLLSAVSMMSTGWGEKPQKNQGWPEEWDVRWEGLTPID